MLNLQTLNPQQREAVVTTDGPVMILAGAGTGKTRVITFRIAHMVAKGISPGHILAVTFTNKAAREMAERVKELVPRPRAREGEPKPEAPTISTFHSFCARLLRQYIELLGYKRNFVIYSESEQLSALKKILSHIHAKGDLIEPAKVLNCISRYKNGALKGKLADDADYQLAERLRSRYESALHACNAVDFDDLLVLAIRLLKEHPDVLQACRAKYRYVMVDEYQDTNSVQFELLQLLTKEHQNVCVVGDDDQSIYGWRGAEIANLLEMEKFFPRVKVIKLEQNYRSTNTILKAANAVIRNNTKRRGKNLWSQKGQGSKISLYAYDTDETEARSVVEQIEYSRMVSKVPWGDNAILFRTNQQSRSLETALRTGRIRYHLIGGQSYFDRREVKDFLAYLKMFLNPHDDVSLLRIANTPARGLSDVTMERLLAASQEHKCSVYAALCKPYVQASFQVKTRESVQEFARWIEHQRSVLQSTETKAVSMRQWAEHWLEEIGYWNELKRSEKDPMAAESRIRNLRDLTADLDKSNQTTLKPMERLQEFLEEISLDNDREDEDEEKPGDAVTLITMHSCKGLEYPHVYIVGVEDGLLPHERSKIEDTLDEERRLFYVAITRARETLAISHCGTRKKFGNQVPCHPSPFLKELPADLVEDVSAKAKVPVTKEAGKSMFANLRAALGD